jgi:hypothetical protein
MKSVTLLVEVIVEVPNDTNIEDLCVDLNEVLIGNASDYHACTGYQVVRYETISVALNPIEEDL